MSAREGASRFFVGAAAQAAHRTERLERLAVETVVKPLMRQRGPLQ